MLKRETIIDWQRLTLNLRSIKTLSAYATELGCDSITLQRLSRAEVAEPRFELGLKLLNAHFDAFPEKHKSLYRCNEKITQCRLKN